MSPFWHFFRKMKFFLKKCRPTFFAYSIVFWLDFQGWGPVKCRKNKKKQLLGNHSFLGADKSGSKAIFIYFLMILGLHFGPPRRPKIKEFMISLRLSVRRAPWIVLGPLFAPFWNHFGVMLGSFLVDFRRCSVLFPMCAESCSGVACSC